MGVPEGVPEGRCGFVLDPDSAGVEIDQFWGIRNMDDWYADTCGACCLRPIWGTSGRCIWHAEVENKPTRELVESRTGNAENFAGSFLHNSAINGEISFESCSLHSANLVDAELEHVNLKNADLTNSNLKEVSLLAAKLQKADLKAANLSSAYLKHANITEANLGGADLSYAWLEKVKASGVNMSRAKLDDVFGKSSDFSNAQFWEAEISEGNFEWASFVGADFSEATFTGVVAMADFRDASMQAADLSNSDLSSSQFDNAELRFANLTNSWLVNSSFVGANLRRATVDGTNFSRSDMSGCDIEDTALIRTNLRQTNLENTRVFGCQFVDVQIDHETNFGENCWYEVTQMDGVKSDRNPNVARISQLDKAVWTYRAYQQLLRENALPDKVPRYYVREKHARRKLALAENDYLKWLKLSLARWTMLYGESSWRVVGTSIVVILVWTVFYLFAGGIEETVDSSDSVTHSLDLPFGPLLDSPPELATTIFANLYFSVVTFTTLGYGDVQPSTGAVQLLAGIQSLLGAALIALLVAVLSRRVMR